MIVRDENDIDSSTVRKVIVAALDRKGEADLVDELRKIGDAVISLVAERDGEIIGHNLFSKLQTPDRCVALAPVSAEPSQQNQGVGSRLIREGLGRAQRGGWVAVFIGMRICRATRL